MTEQINPTSPREVIMLCRRYGLHPCQGLGQHFLIDGNTAAKIIEAAELKAGAPVVEIGPGLGALTLSLARKNVSLLALEIDKGLYALLQDLCRPYPSVTLLHGDALDFDWASGLKKHFGLQCRPTLISNLPYNISSPLLYKLFSLGFPFAAAIIMLQKEVAGRLVASSGEKNYGSLSVIAQYYTTVKLQFAVSRRVFWPQPDVDSAVVRLEPRAGILEPAVERLFWKVVRGTFQQRRKNILNGLLNVFPGQRESLTRILHNALIETRRRPETLSVEEFANLCRFIYNNLEEK